MRRQMHWIACNTSCAQPKNLYLFYCPLITFHPNQTFLNLLWTTNSAILWFPVTYHFFVINCFTRQLWCHVSSYPFSLWRSQVMNLHIISLWFLGGGLLLCEQILNEDKSGPEPATLQSLNMLVQTGGKERTASEYKQLLEKHGFVVVQVKQVHQYSMDAILCTKMWAAWSGNFV